MSRLYVLRSVTILDQILWKIRLFSMLGSTREPNRTMGPLPPCVGPHPAIQRRHLLRAHGVSVPAPRASNPLPPCFHSALPAPIADRGRHPDMEAPCVGGRDLGADATLLEPFFCHDQRCILQARLSPDIALFLQKSLSHPRSSSTLDRARISASNPRLVRQG